MSLRKEIFMKSGLIRGLCLVSLGDKDKLLINNKLITTSLGLRSITSCVEVYTRACHLIADAYDVPVCDPLRDEMIATFDAWLKTKGYEVQTVVLERFVKKA